MPANVSVFLLAAICLPGERIVCAADAAATSQATSSVHPLDRRPQPWERRGRPILSATTTRQSWCKVVLYSPHVIYHDKKFRMWYLGTSTATRTNDIVMGYAESDDGIDWKEFPGNPILTGKDVPWGTPLQTPFVLFDREEKIYKMWFVCGRGIRRDKNRKVLELDQRLWYATSADGIHWKVRPKPIFASGRSPSVIKEGPHRYRMWMGSAPGPKSVWNDIYKNIYEFTSTDGIHWKRGMKPVIRPAGKATSTIYPFVIRERGLYYMWYGCHVPGGFELFCSTSKDGTRWDPQQKQPAFPARKDRAAFDGRYTSTPCVVRRPDRYLLYYSARDWKTTYIDGKGRRRKDNAGVYAHIGVAAIPIK